MQLSRGGLRARLVAAVFAAVAGSIFLAGPAAAKPSGSGGGGPARGSSGIVPGAENPSGMAPEIYFVLIAVGLAVACAVLAFKASRHLRRQRAASPQV